MKCLKKVSLAKRTPIPADVQVALLNDRVKKQLFQRSSTETKPPRKPLLDRLWPGIEHYPKVKRQEAIKIVKKLDASPSLQINDSLEMIYNGDVIRGTNILQLIRCELYPAKERVLLPGQDLFYHALITSPTPTRQVDFVSPEPVTKKRRKKLPTSVLKNRKKLKGNLLHPSSARKSLQFSPIRLRSSSRYAPKTSPFKERRWHK